MQWCAMTSCAALGMRTSSDIEPSHVYSWQSPSMMGRPAETRHMDESPMKKQKQLLKKLDSQMASITRMLMLLIAIELLRMFQT